MAAEFLKTFPMLEDVLIESWQEGMGTGNPYTNALPSRGYGRPHSVASRVIQCANRNCKGGGFDILSDISKMIHKRLTTKEFCFDLGTHLQFLVHGSPPLKAIAQRTSTVFVLSHLAAIPTILQYPELKYTPKLKPRPWGGCSPMWEDSRYFWVVLCKNHWFHVPKNLFFRHRILLAETDAIATRPAIDQRFRVRCDECGQEYLYKPSEVFRCEQQEIPESFIPHPLFSNISEE